MERNHRKVRVGTVVSDKMDKTVLVKFEKYHSHPFYNKKVKVTRKYLAHDEENACGIGDRVRIMETRPLSRRKNWRVVEILEKAK